MVDKVIEGTDLRAEDKIDKLREQIQNNKFKDYDEICQFVNYYISAYPDEASGKSTSLIDELVGNIRSELGLAFATQQDVTKIISDHVSDLIRGYAQASDDTARWAVHHAANRVTMYSGQFVYEAEDIFIDGAGMDFLFRRTYKSQGFHNGPIGINWDHNYNLKLRKVDGDQKIVCLTGGFQESTYVQHGLYGHTGFNYWISPHGEHSIIIDISRLQHRQEYDIQLPQNCQDCHYALRTSDGVLYIYEEEPNLSAHYRIKWILDRFSNYIKFDWSNAQCGPNSLIEQVFLNNLSRKISFNYDSQDRIIFIKDYNKRTWSYTYDDYGDLITFTTPATDRYPQGHVEHYVYTTPNYTGELQHNLSQIYDTAGRNYLDNEYGADRSLLSFNRVTRQREGHGERLFEYEDLSLVTGLPTGQPEVEEDIPAFQTVMVRRNGHPVHYIYNKFGNLIAREEDCWARGTRRRLVTHYRYNRDGALIGELSPEGRMTQYLYGRDEFMRHSGDLTENQLRLSKSLTWEKRLGFGNRLAVVQRYRKKSFSAFQFPSPLKKLQDVAHHPHPKDIITKFTFDNRYQSITSVSNPKYTDSPFPDSTTNPDPNPHYKKTLTIFKYDPSKKLLKSIKYPDCTRDGQTELKGIEENFIGYDSKGRLTDYEDQVGTRTKLLYFPLIANHKEGYLKQQIIDPIDPQVNPKGLNLNTKYEVNKVGVVKQITTPKNQVIEFEIDNLNRQKKVTRTLKTGVAYETRYTYCRNMHIERIERDLQDGDGQPLWGGTEVQFFHFDENDNISREQVGSHDFDDHLITHHTYDDGDLHIGTTLPRGNRARISYDERRLPKKIERGVGSSEAVKIKIVYDGDGFLREQRDGRGLKTEFYHDSFGRLTETRDYDEQENLYRLIRHDYDKAGNLTIERLFKPDGNVYKLLYHASYNYNELNQRIEKCLRCFQIPISYTSDRVEKDIDYVPLDEAVRFLYFYDKAGRPTRMEQHGRRLDANGLPQPNNTILASEYEYNSVGWLRAEIDQVGNRTEIHYDKHGLVKRADVREKVPLSDSTTEEEIFTTFYKYDNLDRLISIKDGLGNLNLFEFDSRDKIIRQEDPLGNITHFDYDVYGRKVAERIEMTDTGLGGGTRQPNSDIVTQYVLDANGNIIQLIDAHNNIIHQVYDDLDRRIELKFTDDTAMTYRYDGNDNVVWIQDNNGLIKRTIYDPLDNPLRLDVDRNELKPNIVIEGATYEAYEFDALNQMTRARNDWADIQYKMDSLGRAYKESVKFSDHASVFTLKRDYDDFDFLSRITYPNGRVLTYQPDELNRIKRIENKEYGANYPGNISLQQERLILENTYRGFRIGSKFYGNGTSTDYAYDGVGRVISILHKDAQSDELLTIQHLYDALGNMRFKREFAPNNNYGEVYKYDSRSQLTLFQETQLKPTNTDRLNLKALAPSTLILAENQCKGQRQVINPLLGSLEQVHNQFTFKYDKLGNRLEERPPKQQQPINYTPNNLNQYTQRNNTQFLYDHNGNLSQEKTGGITRDYIYNHRNQIVRVKEGGNLAQFRYDALGRRIWSDNGVIETYIIYSDENVIEEIRPAVQESSESIIQYVNEIEIDSRCQITTLAEELWYHKDLIGSSRLLTNINGSNIIGNELAFYRFTPFGIWNLSTKLPTLQNVYLFAGRRYNAEIESYDFRARQYSPTTGVFLQRDPEEYKDRLNLYVYTKNNPAKFVDPHGTQARQQGQWRKEMAYRIGYWLGKAKRDIKYAKDVEPRSGKAIFRAIDSTAGAIATTVMGTLYTGGRVVLETTQNLLGMLPPQLDELSIAAQSTGIPQGQMAAGILKVSSTGLRFLSGLRKMKKASRFFEISRKESVIVYVTGSELKAATSLEAKLFRRAGGINREILRTGFKDKTFSYHVGRGRKDRVIFKEVAETVTDTLHPHYISKIALPSGDDVLTLIRENFSASTIHKITGEKWRLTNAWLQSEKLEKTKDLVTLHIKQSSINAGKMKRVKINFQELKKIIRGE